MYDELLLMSVGIIQAIPVYHNVCTSHSYSIVYLV